jgi:CheY-like chemotaxis protein
MAHGLAEQSGGRLTIRSQRGLGTTVEMCLPAVERPKTYPPAAADETPEAPLRSSSQRRILVVDDDVLVSMNTAAMLEDLGHVPVEASSGDAALSLLQENGDFDLIITDQAMPGMTGLQLIEKVRTMRPDIPVVVATGYAELPEGETFDVPKLTKPFDQRQLAEAVGDALSKSEHPKGPSLRLASSTKLNNEN